MQQHSETRASDTRRAETHEEAERVLRLCSACMYCDGFCAVFPAIAGKATFSLAEVAHLANLCHACRGCWYACQYAPPHPFAVNLPQALAAAREASYAGFVRPRCLAPALDRPMVAVAVVLITTLAMVLGVLIAVPSAELFAVHRGEGAFYEIVPLPLMSAAAGLSCLWAVASLAWSTLAFWRAVDPRVKRGVLRKALKPALRDIVTLKNLGGGGHGCNDVDGRFSRERRWSHHLLVGGLLGTLVATVSAAALHHLAGLAAPYGWTSLPVLSGALGGVAMLAGIGGLAAIELRGDRDPTLATERRHNAVFLALLALVAASGLAVLVLRETGLMGLVLTLHLGLVTGFFLALPMSKMIHAPFRAVALLRAAIDRIVAPPRRSGGE